MPRRKPTLTARMRDFSVHYATHGNGQDAAIAAGYSPNSAKSRGSQLAAHPLVAAEIRRLRGETTQSLADTRSDELDDRADEIDRSLAGLAVLKGCLMVEMDQVIYHDPLALWRAAGFSGAQLAALEALDPVDRRQVQGLKQTHTIRRFGRGKDVNETEETTLELKMRPRDPATMRMARHVGIGNTTKVEVGGPGGGPVQHEVKGLTQVTLDVMIEKFLGVPAHVMRGLPAPEGEPA